MSQTASRPGATIWELRDSGEASSSLSLSFLGCTMGMRTLPSPEVGVKVKWDKPTVHLAECLGYSKCLIGMNHPFG